MGDLVPVGTTLVTPDFKSVFFNIRFGMVQNHKKLIDAHKAEILVKCTDCAELSKITITNCLIYFFFQILQISLLFNLFD